MKIKFILLLINTLLLLPCEIIAQKKINHALLYGFVEPHESDLIKLNGNAHSISKNGTFEFEAELELPDFYSLEYRNFKIDLFISPGDSLHINFDGRDVLQSIIITGNNSKLNTFLLNQTKLRDKTDKYLNENRIKYFTSESSFFISKIDSIKQYYLTNFYDFMKHQTNVSEWFQKKYKAEIVYSFDRIKLLYPGSFNRNTGKVFSEDPDFYNKITENAFNDPEILRSQTFLNFLNKYLDIQAAGKYKFMDFYQYPVNIKGVSRYQAIIDLNAHQDIKDFLLYQQLKTYLNDYGTRGLENMLTNFKNDCKNETQKNEVLQFYNQILKQRQSSSEIKIFRKIGDVDLEAHIFYPEDFNKSDHRPCYIYFHGGSWRTGMPEWGYESCKRYASKGMVSISFEYRSIDLNGIKIPDCIADAKYAVYWVRKYATELGIDTGRIVADGFSSGGHLVACTAILPDYHDKESDKTISCKPNAIILESAVYSTKEYNNLITGGNGESISPLYQLKNNLVPTLMFHGKEDTMVPYKDFEGFVEKMEKLHNKFSYKSFEGVGHFYYSNPEYGAIATKMIDDFLISLNYIKK